MKVRVASLVVCAALTLVMGCGASAKKKEEKVTIGWLAKGASNTFFDLSRHAAQLAAQDLSSSSGREVEVVLLDAEGITAEEQLTRAEAAIDMGVDALNISVLNPDLLTPVLDRAVDSGIPVLTFDSDAPKSKRTSFYGISNRAGAVKAAQLLARLMGKKGKVAIMTQAGTMPGTLSSSQTFTERLAGFSETMAAEAPEIEIVMTIPCGKVEEMEKAGCTALLEEITLANPEVTGWYLARGRALREASIATLAPTWAAKAIARDVKVVAFDAQEDALHSVQNGYAHALIGQDYFGWGYDVVNLSFDVVAFNRTLEPFTDSQFEVVCSNNIDQLVSMWAAKDFRSALAPCDILP